MNSPPLFDILAKAEQLHADGCLEQAAELYQHILAANPNLSRTAYNLGIIQLELQNYSGAERAFRHCLSFEPHLLEARLNQAFSLQEQGRIVEARLLFQSILRSDPNCTEARFNLACLNLLQGDYVAGLPDYELRFETSDPVAVRHDQIPLWNGTARPGLRLLIHAEQGYGDTLQMLRYVPLLRARELNLTLEVPAPLFPLCSRIEGITCRERGAPLPEVDCRLPIMSLPLVMGTVPETIPADTPYLTPDPELVKQWKRRLADTTRLRVGLAWTGRLDLPVNRKRSCPSDLLRQLLQIEQACFVSLQILPPAGFQLNDPALLDLSTGLTDFQQTAALIANLDLVITIDTAIAHLAGALNVPTWLMLPAVPDWRWMLDRTDSPWYPSMRLFRQPTPGDWQAVLGEVKDQLITVSSPRVWRYVDGRDFDSSLTSTRPVPLSDLTRWPALGLREAEQPEAADWLLFPFYLEHLAEFYTIEGMWSFLRGLKWFDASETRHIFFSDHDSEAAYHSPAVWFRASIDPKRHDPAARALPFQVDIPEQYLHFDPSRLRYHTSFVGHLGDLRERAAFVNGVIAEPRLVHKLDLTTMFHLHQTDETRQERRISYLESSSASISVLCPRGAGSSSVRLFETLALGRIAVVQEPILLPFEDRIDYERFVIRVPEGMEGESGRIIFDWLTSLSDVELLARCREARSAWEQHLAPDSMAAGIVRHLAQTALRGFGQSQAVSRISAPGDWFRELQHGATLMLEKRFGEARAHLLAAQRENPRSSTVLLTLAGVEQEMGDDASARAHLQETILYDHRCYDAYLALGCLLARAGEPEAAVGRLYQASLLRPDEPAPYRMALSLLRELGRDSEAAFCHTRLAELNACGESA